MRWIDRAPTTAFVLLTLCFATNALGEPVPLPAQPAGLSWPTQEWPMGPLPAGIDAKAFRAAMDEAFSGSNEKLGETREVVIVSGGRLVHEQYAAGYTPDTKLVSWSMAKSVTQALVAVAVQQGRVDIDRAMGNPMWASSDRRAQIPWRSWLQMTDGQRSHELRAKTITENDGLRALFGPGRLDVARFCAELPLINEPGTHWNYNSCGFVLTADALTRAIVAQHASPEARRAAMLAWMHEALFDVLGMHPQPEFDATGLFLGNSFVYASARDFAKLGLLYLRDGVWDGRRVLPEGWVDYSRTPGAGTNADIYGAGWWISPQQGLGRPYPVGIDTGSVRDAFSAQGIEGELLLVVPSKDLIVVRLGRTSETQMRSGEIRAWVGRVARAFPPSTISVTSASSSAN